MLRAFGVVCVVGLLASPVRGQTPQPFPRPTPRPEASQPAKPTPPAPAVPPGAPTATTATKAPLSANAPTAATLGFAIYPAAQFLASYDAGRGQRYYLFGATAAFADVVGYYRKVLDEGGDLVFKDPPTHMFEAGRFREETMAFPPGVTVKDWTWGGSAGFPNPTLGGQPARFPTVIMIVPVPAAQAPQR